MDYGALNVSFQYSLVIAFMVHFYTKLLLCSIEYLTNQCQNVMNSKKNYITKNNDVLHLLCVLLLF